MKREHSKNEHNLKSLTQVLEDLREQGYSTDFRFEKNRLLTFDRASKSYHVSDIAIVDVYRFEGNTDPADDSVLYVIMTGDGRKGTISNGYRAFANPDLDEFMNKASADVETAQVHKG